MNCFKSISLIIVRSQGPRAPKVGPRLCVYPAFVRGSGSQTLLFGTFWRSRGALVRIFAESNCRPSPPHVSGGVRGLFLESVRLKKDVCFVCFCSLGGGFLSRFYFDSCYTFALAISLFARWAKRHRWLSTHKNQCFLMVRCTRRRLTCSKEDNRGHRITKTSDKHTHQTKEKQINEGGAEPHLSKILHK